MLLEIHKQTPCRLPRQKISKLFRTVLRREHKLVQPGRINLIFTNNSFIRNLNQRYRQKSQATDVLAFQVDNPKDNRTVMGEIYISIPTARRQAREYGVGIYEEILRLTCHGLLHLLGYDHMKNAEAEKMFSLQEKYLRITKKVAR